jgi:peptide/nickel transport system permease protein
MESIQVLKVSRPSRLAGLAIFWRRLRRYPATMVGIGIILFFLFMAIFGPLVAPYGYAEQIASDRLQTPSAKHWLGTDQYGRDILSRILVGSRDIYLIAGSGTALAVLMGLTVGLSTGYYGGFLDEIVMRLLDVLLAIPPLLLAMVLLGTVGPSRVNVILIIGFLYIPMVSRVVRSVVLDLKTREFVEAAKLRGETVLYILFREILPNALPALAVEASMRFSYAIFLAASLGFLGLGVQPPAPDWGLMVGEARDWFSQAPWVLLFPAGAIAMLVIGVGFTSDGLRRILRPGGISE